MCRITLIILILTSNLWAKDQTSFSLWQKQVGKLYSLTLNSKVITIKTHEEIITFDKLACNKNIFNKTLNTIIMAKEKSPPTSAGTGKLLLIENDQKRILSDQLKGAQFLKTLDLHLKQKIIQSKLICSNI